MKGHSSGISSVSFSPDGMQILTGSYDGLAIIWDSKTGSNIGEPFKGHTKAISSVCFSPDGKRIVTGSHDGLAKIWDIKSRT